MKVPPVILVYAMCICTATCVTKTEGCIASPTSRVSDFILNNLNASSCMVMHRKQEVVPPEALPLLVNKSCVNGVDVEIMTLLSGHQDCPATKFLFVPHDGQDCSRKKRCQTTRTKEFGHNKTLCLLECKTSRQDNLHYGLELINGIQDFNMELCGVKLYNDHCAKNPCSINEICDDNIDTYICRCQPDYTGSKCETQIDDCAGNPCQNSGSCEDGINSFTCTCASGFIGTMCETEVDECESSPCQNDGTCQDAVNSFICDCIDGFTGEICETDVDDCAGVICQNNGTCVDRINNYTCSCHCEFNGRNCETRLIIVEWIQPSSWIGPNHVFYRSFDSMYCLVLMEGTELANYEALSPGKTNSGVSTNRTKRQWIDVGNHPEVCMTRPEICGAAGGAISLWVKVVDCDNGGILTTTQKDSSTGSFIFCKNDELGFGIHLSDGRYYSGTAKSDDWLHVVLNFLGPNEGITIYHDGVEQKSDGSKKPYNYTEGHTKIAIGRRHSESDKKYASVQVDELLFFNQALSDDDISMLITDIGFQPSGIPDVVDQTTPFMVGDGSWTPPTGWTGPGAVNYWSFDTSNGLVLMEGTQEMGSIPLVSGKVNTALTLNRTKRQWVDLGVHIETCLTRPETCGAAGGAISLWVKVMDCTHSSGIISSQVDGSSGSGIGCNSDYLGFDVNLLDGYFSTHVAPLPGWIHIVLSFIGPNDGEGIRIYYDGEQVDRNTTKATASRLAGDGRIIVGRLYTDQDRDYASVKVDELIFFNQFLTQQEVQSLFAVG